MGGGCSSTSDGAVTSSPNINTDPIGPILQSPFFATQQNGIYLAPKSIVKQPQQQPTIPQHLIQLELIQPPNESDQVIFSSKPNCTVNDNNEMPNNTIMNPTIAVNDANGSVTDDPALFDPWCDPKNPRTIQFQDISAAAFKIKSGIMMTPCTRSHLSNITGTTLFFKKDFLQYTGSFKVHLITI